MVRDGRIGHKYFASQNFATPSRSRLRREAPTFDSPRRQSSLPAHPFLTTFGAGWENRSQIFCFAKFRYPVSLSPLARSSDLRFSTQAKQFACSSLPHYVRCGMGESNSRPRFGKPLLYHLTNPALFLNSKILAKNKNLDKFVEVFVSEKSVKVT